MRIGKTTATLMISVSVFFDIVEAILAFFAIGLLINRVLVLIKWSIFLIWFWSNHVYVLKSPKRLKIAGVTFIAGLIPVIGALPEFTLGIVKIIHDIRQEDTLKDQSKKQERERMSSGRKRK